MSTFAMPKLFIICMLLILKGPIILSKKWSAHTDKPSSSSFKLNECLRCKVLTDSFNTWLDRTSRGKHEGGDAAWEEAKLKSYARSEMRLVEIQERLCSEVKTHQDHCYSLAEEVEQLVEKWWFHENDFDLYTWLCIENLKYCCPHHHFGEECIPCPRDKNNKICGNNGKCDGDGTRKGNGTCICTSGYSGDNCDECATNYYNALNTCKPCHQSCNECYSDGANACVQCAPGWRMEVDVCIDVNECLDSSVCEDSAFCLNREGSYACKPCDRTCKTCTGSGPINCTSCKAASTLWGGKCVHNDNLKTNINAAYKRIAVYLCLCVLIIIIFRKSKPLASFVALFISLLLYLFEKNSEIRLIDVYNYYY